MKPLTFAGFLKKYVQDLSGMATLNCRKLAKAAEVESPRLREPLAMLLFLTHSPEACRKALRGCSKTSVQFNYLNAFQSVDDLFDAMENQTAELPERFLKAYRSYRSVRDRNKNEQWTKSLMRKRILKLQAEKHMTDYRIYTALRLNPGNYSEFMRHQKLNRLSLSKVRRILFFLENAGESFDEITKKCIVKGLNTPISECVPEEQVKW